jgi:hypothetical protein
MKFAIGALITAAGASSALGQVFINEVFENPPGPGGTNDAVLEYIEFYGPPGFDLTGYAIGLFKGGSDMDGDDIPTARPEIDEAFSLDGLAIGSNGFLILYNGPDGGSLTQAVADPAATAASFFDAHIPSTDSNGNLSNDQSSTYLLVRNRPNHSVANGVSVYGPGYAILKDPNPDVDFDGKLDFGLETMTFAGAPLQIDPLQIIDEVAWSNDGGKEYVRSSEQEISETPGFNPDAVSRVDYFGTNPMLGLRINSAGETVPTRMADEEFVYGQTEGDISNGYSFDAVEFGAPTDPNGDGFQDLSAAGFVLTPGTFNDGGNFTQFRIVRGDFNFDKVVDVADQQLIIANQGFDLDRTTPCTDPFGNPFTCWFYEGRAANGLLAMREMVTDDALGGGNAPEVTQADVDQFNAEFGPFGCNPADLATPFGQLTFGDIGAFLGAFDAMDPAADLAAPFGEFTFGDVGAFLGAFNAGCP